MDKILTQNLILTQIRNIIYVDWYFIPSDAEIEHTHPRKAKPYETLFVRISYPGIYAADAVPCGKCSFLQSKNQFLFFQGL